MSTEGTSTNTMKKIWLVGLGAMLVSAISANASLSFVWSHAQPPTISSGGTVFTWVDTADGGPVTFTATLEGAVTLSPSFIPTPAPDGQERFDATFSDLFTPSPLPPSGSFIDFSVSTSVPGAKLVNFPFSGVTTKTGNGLPALTFPSETTIDEGVLSSGAPLTPTSTTFDIQTITFGVIPETNTLAIALGAAVVGATVLFRSRRSSVA
jgi:hypothetical protein